jgi:ribonuclease HII
MEQARVTRTTLAYLRQRYVIEGRSLEASVEAELRADGRAGAKAILQSVAQRRTRNRAEGQRLRGMMHMENALRSKGIVHVAGVDEAGMSPLAGPVAAAAVILPAGLRIAGINDSKQLDAASREEIAVKIKTRAIAWSIAFAEVEEIDRINIYWAGILAMRRAVEGLRPMPQHLLIDARLLKDVALPQDAIIRGDAKCACIAAASILAKTARDTVMRKLDRRYPGYGFAEHKGYPVRFHYSMLSKLGACPVHRRSFAPVRAVLGLPPLPPWTKPADAT